MSRMIDWLQKPAVGGITFGVLVIIGIALLAVIFVCLGLRLRKKRKTAACAVCVPCPVTQTPSQAKIAIKILQGQGEREEQQDAYGICQPDDKDGVLLVLCDGMGGMNKGAEIAQQTVREIMTAFPMDEKNLGEWRDMLKKINSGIFDSYHGGGGTTLVMAYIEENRLWFWSIGDSDLFLLRNGLLYQMNQKHEFKNKLMLQSIREGIPVSEVFSDPQKDSLYEFIGNDMIDVDETRNPFLLCGGDRLLLCSDGVSDTISLGKLERIMTMDLETCTEEIEKEILNVNQPFQDNYTALIARYQN